MLYSTCRFLCMVILGGLILPAGGHAEDLLSKIHFELPPVTTSEQSNDFQTDYLALFDAKIQSWMTQYDIKAVSYTVISPNANGTRFFGSGNSLNTVWQPASVSKHMAATALVKMMNNPAVTLDTVVGYPIFSDTTLTPIATIRDFMSHTSGIPNAAGDSNLLFGYDLQETTDTLKFYPDQGFREMFQYNNQVFHLGFQKASEILDSTAIEQLNAFFEAADMTNTNADFNVYSENSNLITMYDLYGVAHPYNVEQGLVPAAGGIATTIRDLNTFLSLHLNPPSWLAQSNLDQIYEEIIESGGPNGDHYGVGTAIFNLIDVPVRGHLGLVTTGVSTAVLYDVENQIGIAVLVNSPNAAPLPLFIYLYLLLRGASVEAADAASQNLYDILASIIETFKCNTQLPPNTVEAKKLRGVYSSDKLGELKIFDKHVKVGNLDPVPITYNGIDFGAVGLVDVNQEKQVAIGTPQINNAGHVTAMQVIYNCGDGNTYLPK